MSTPKKKGLNKKLNALLGTTTKKSQSSATTTSDTTTKNESTDMITTIITNNPMREIPIEFLQRNHYQPRHDFTKDKLTKLTESIKTQELIQPIVVHPINEKRYEIIANKHR
jgi:Predicted transcriptional regulators